MKKTVFIFLSVICIFLSHTYRSHSEVPECSLPADREIKTVLSTDLTPGTLYSDENSLPPYLLTDLNDNQGISRRLDHHTYRIKRPDYNLFFRLHIHTNFIKENNFLHTLSYATTQPVERCNPDFYLHTLQRLII